MSHRRVQDRVSGRTSRTFDSFLGSHYGTGKCDQPDVYAYVSDLQFTHNKPWLRDGARKNQKVGYGYNGTITSVFPIGIGGTRRMGVVVNGTLSVYPVDDVIAGLRRYYTWNEVEQKWTWDDLQRTKTWDDLLNTRETT